MEWIYLLPNPSYGRDIGLSTSAGALHYSPQAESANPAGLSLWKVGSQSGLTVVTNPAGLYSLSRYTSDESSGRRTAEQISEASRLLLNTIGYYNPYINVALLLNRPVMSSADTNAFQNFESSSSLSSHQNSIQATVRINPRVSFGGRIDRYFHYSDPTGEGYGYGVLFRPKGLTVGVFYQRFPGSGAQIWHPLDRRRDGTTSAAIAWNKGITTATFQMFNLTEPNQLAYLEPHSGIEVRPNDWISLRAGAALYTRSKRWSWSTGLALVNANRFRSRTAALLVPDDVLQLSLAMIYRHRVPEIGIFSLTTAWRF